MADVTERLKLYLTPASTDKTFLSWRTEMSGDTDSNMVKLDEAIAVLQDAMAGKQEELTFDDTPAADSRNPVTSAGIKSYVDAAVAGKDIGVSTFNGRTGAVTPAAGDYTCEMVGADPAGSAAAVRRRSKRSCASWSRRGIRKSPCWARTSTPTARIWTLPVTSRIC